MRLISKYLNTISLPFIVFISFIFLFSCKTADAQSQIRIGTPTESTEIASLLALRQQYSLSVGDMFQRRDAFEKMMKLATPAPTGVNISIVSANGIPAELISSQSTSRQHGKFVILYLHGGGFYSGSSATHRALAATLAKKAGSDVLLINYRRMPEHLFPSQVDDTVSSYKWLLAQGYPSGHVAIAGDSVGGGLAVELAIRLRDSQQPLPVAIVAMSPVTDLSASGQSMSDNAGRDPIITHTGTLSISNTYLAGGDLKNPLASPLYADLQGLPPLLIQVGSTEVLLDDSIRLSRAAGQMDVDVTLEIWPGMIHQWQLFPTMLRDADNALTDSGMFIRTHFQQSSPTLSRYRH